MIQKEAFHKSERIFVLFLAAFGVFGFFYQLGIYPLFLEEPRRGLIAMEMALNDNYWVPTIMGDFYFRKPPVFNWLILAGFKLFGYHEIALRVVSILSHFTLMLAIFFFTRKRLGVRLSTYCALGYGLSADILFYFSSLGEIDLFYALITTTSIFAIFYFGEKQKYWQLFSLVYLFTAIGFLTKGIPSLPFTAISLLVYFIYSRRFKVLFSLQHAVGVLIFLVLVGGYFLKYSQYGPVENWFTVLYSESADKAVNGSIGAFFSHFLSFPFVVTGIVFPACLLLPFWFKKGVFRELIQNRLVCYCLLIFIFNFLIYWLSISARTRYIYPILPFLVIFLTSVLTQVAERNKYLRTFILVSIGVFMLAVIYIPFETSLDVVSNRPLITVGLLSLFSLILYPTIKRSISPYLSVFGVLVVLKIGFSSIVPITRAYDSGTAIDKESALELASLVKGKEVYRYGNVQFNLKTSFYLEREQQAILKNIDHFNERFYILSKKDFPVDRDYTVLFQLRYQYDDVYLIEIL